MKIKNLVSLILSFSIAAAIFPSAMAEEADAFKTVTANVAQYKEVTVSPAENEDTVTYPGKNLVDGMILDTYTAPVNGSVLNDITIDLEKRYKVKKIELYVHRYADEEISRKDFQILGSNDEDFSTYDVLGGIGETLDDTIFPNRGAYTINLSGDKPYRYIRVHRTGAGWYLYADLKVYADITVTEISKNAEAYSAVGYYQNNSAFMPQNVLDNNIQTLWLTEYDSGFHDITINLGEKYPIGYLEMDVREDQSSYNFHNNAEIYGSNAIISDEEILATQYLTSEQGYTKIAHIVRDYYDLDYFKCDTQFFDNGMHYGEAVSDKTAYQYITLKRKGNGATILSDIRAYVINPEPVEVYSDGNYVYVVFSDDMDFSDLSGVKMEGAEFEIENSYTLKADISELDKAAKHTISISGLSAQNGTAMVKEYEFDLDTLYPWSVGETELFVSNEKVNNFHNADDINVKTEVTNHSAASLTALGVVGLYSEDGRLVKAAVSDTEIGAHSSGCVSASMSIENTSEEMYLKAYVWEKGEFTPISDSKTFYNRLTSIYVSKDGSDENRGTFASPFATLSRAQAEIRANNSNMDEDINVYVCEGTYELPETLAFDDSDSGTNGNRVNWQALENEDVTISGGVKIEGWTEGENGIWSASITDERIETIRELYVNDKKAVRAKSENKIAPLSFYEEDGVISGYYVSSEDVGAYNNAQDIQLKYARGWSSITLNIDSIEDAGDGKAIIKMKQPDFSMMTFFESAGTSNPAEGSLYHIFWLNEENKFYMENAYELLDNPGEFYFDKASRMLYYKGNGENMAEAQIYAPVLDEIITVSGSDLKNKAENISFSGFTFAHAAYSRFENGHLGDQAQTQIVVDFPKSSYAPDNIIVGANIKVSEAANIEFSDNVFYGLGAVGIGLYNGAESITISENTFYDTGDSAITVGLPTDAYIQDTTDGVNVALFKPVSASHEEWGNFAAYVNDGDAKRGWNMVYDGDYQDEWVQIDLEASYNIDRVVLKQRSAVEYPGTNDRSDFKVLASNNADFSGGGVVIASQGEEDYAEEGDFVGYVSDNTKYRYIRIMKTKNEYSYFPEIEVITKDTDVPVQEVCKNNTISNNYITRAGEFNWGAPGIQTYYTEGTKIINNTLYDLPYSGICFGWGWTNTPDSTTSKNNEVRNNVISDYALICYDSGGIYTLGQEPGSIIDGNYIKNQTNAYAAYYPDSGSSLTTVTNNVFENIDMAYHIYSDKQSYLTVYNNWSTISRYKDLGFECTVSAPTLFLPSEIPAEAQAIIDKAGAPKAVIDRAPQRERERTFEEMYGNVLEENNPEILSMPNSVLSPNYLESRITEAYDVISLVGDRGDEALKEALLQKVAEAEEITATEQTIKNASKLDMINLRIGLIDAIKAYYNSIN